RREPLNPDLVVHPQRLSVDPAEAERLFDGVDVGDGHLAGVLLVEGEPDCRPIAMVAFQPAAPRGARSQADERRDGLRHAGQLAALYCASTQSGGSGSSAIRGGLSSATRQRWSQDGPKRPT